MADTALPAYEKLGAFYLGRRHELAGGETTAEDVLYDSKDLTTHAVCVGMTGSGKTGLCVSLIEEAAIDGVPTIAIDPKGDIANLLLTFPELRGADFEPWVDPAEAQRKGKTPAEFAEAQAALWKSGLAKWGQDGERIRRLRAAADFSVYTPGSSAGRALTPLKSMDPPAAGASDEEIRERVVSTASGLLALLGLDADPIQSREHILLSSILETAWRQGRGLDLPRLIGQIQSPPFARVGVLDVDTFLPPKDRGALAMRVNNLLASPGFAGWMEGEALDIQRLLYTAEGKPRVSILSIAHLSDAERMFFVTLVLGELIAWMRRQPGTGSLRAVLYMDEVFGFFPPSANPPSKTPLLTLMKQARAYGVGCVLATQNPVDLDYKGLSNAGTWLLGRLQTERDKMRVIEGLEGASAQAGGAFDRQAMDRTLAGLGSRVFLLHNVHENGPVVFHTRWAMSYLRGPMTREEIRRLGQGAGEAASASAPAAAATETALAPVSTPTAAAAASPRGGAAGGVAPIVPAGVGVSYAPISLPVRAGEALVYRPAVLATAQLHYVHSPSKVDEWRDCVAVAFLCEESEGHSVWDGASVLDAQPPALDDEPDSRGSFEELPAGLTPKSPASWGRALKEHLYRHGSRSVWKCAELKAVSALGEGEGVFRARVRDLAHEKRDLEVEKLRGKYGSKLATLEERLRKAEQAVERERSQARKAGIDSAVSIGTSILGVLMGRKKVSATSVSKAGTAARSVGRAAQQRGDIGRAEETVEAVQEQIAALNAELEKEIAAVSASCDPSAFAVEEQSIAPRKSDLSIGEPRLVWLPFRVSAGRSEAAYRLA
jgi:hypothetical protein